MSEQPVRSIAVVCEAEADRRIACDLADRVVCERADWITPKVIGDYRGYRGLEPTDTFLAWSHIPSLARRRRIKAHGHFDGKPGDSDAVAGRRALLLFVGVSPMPDAVLLIRDTDGDKGRIEGLNQARDAGTWAFQVVIGAAHPKRECWVLAGFEPQGDDEDARLQGLRNELGIDPRENAERLDAGRDPQGAEAKKNAKRVLQVLTGGAENREVACWTVTPLAVLEARGGQTGLAAYLNELRGRLVPMFTGLIDRPSGGR